MPRPCRPAWQIGSQAGERLRCGRWADRPRHGRWPRKWDRPRCRSGNGHSDRARARSCFRNVQLLSLLRSFSRPDRNAVTNWRSSSGVCGRVSPSAEKPSREVSTGIEPFADTVFRGGRDERSSYGGGSGRRFSGGTMLSWPVVRAMSLTLSTLSGSLPTWIGYHVRPSCCFATRNVWGRPRDFSLLDWPQASSSCRDRE